MEGFEGPKVPESAFKSLDLKVFTDALEATALEEGAVGLAASQLGVDARIIVLDPKVSSGSRVNSKAFEPA